MPLALRRSSTRSTLACLAWFFLFSSLPVIVLGQPKAPDGIVDKLATTNVPPTIHGEPGEQRANFGDKFDAAEFKRVDAVSAEVVRQAEKLWPELVAHLGDDRYSKTVGIDQGYPRNWSVGDLCQHIIGATLSEAYYRHIPGTKANYHQFSMPSIAGDKVKLRAWCVARKDRKLFELQMEICEWAITEIKASDMDVEEKGRLATVIKKEIESLKKSRSAICCPRPF